MTLDAKLLFQPYSLGDLELKNRIVMAPLTRNRATHGTDAPNELNAEYYRQRASAGLLITEATQISQQGQGYIWTPGIYTAAQVEGWQKVTKAVHSAGGKIVMPALACRPRLACLLAAEWRRARLLDGCPRQHKDLHRRRLCRCLDAARAQNRRDSLDRARL